MDYLTRKSIAISTGAVGTWLSGDEFQRLGAIGVRVPPDIRVTSRLDRREVTEAFTDLGLIHLLPQHGGLRPAEVEEALAEAGTPGELKQRTIGFLLGVAHKALIDQGRRT